MIVFQAILRGVNGLLIILSVLQLCLSISCVILGIKAIKKCFKKENKVQLGGGGPGTVRSRTRCS